MSPSNLVSIAAGLATTLLAGAGCGAPLDRGSTFNQFDVRVVDGPEPTTSAFLDVIASATDTLHVALPAGEDTALTDAIIAAADREVAVEVVTDFDVSGDPGIADLLAAGIDVTLADDGIGYFDFSINTDVAWRSDQTVMSEAFAVADRRRALIATSAGRVGDGSRVLVGALGEEFIEDLLIEHNQVFGGADSVSTTAYDNLAKSIADERWLYPDGTDVGTELWFGPQERLTKRVIDSVYGSQASVWIVTNDLANDGLAAALQTKAAQGWDVRVIVGPAFGTTSVNQSRIFEVDTPDVLKRQLQSDVVPTMVLVDLLPQGDRQRRAIGMVLSHDLYSSARLYQARAVVTDQLIDGTLVAWTDATDAPSGPLLELRDAFERLWEQGASL